MTPQQQNFLLSFNLIPFFFKPLEPHYWSSQQGHDCLAAPRVCMAGGFLLTLKWEPGAQGHGCSFCSLLPKCCSLHLSKSHPHSWVCSDPPDPENSAPALVIWSLDSIINVRWGFCCSAHSPAVDGAAIFLHVGRMSLNGLGALLGRVKSSDHKSWTELGKGSHQLEGCQRHF